MTDLVRLFQSTDAGAPSMTYAAGQLLGVLSACLVTGYGSVTLDSLVVSNGVATGTKSGGHGFSAFGNTDKVYPVLRVSGVTDKTDLNADWRLASIPNGTTFTFACPGVSDGTASGTISAKRAPADWTEAFTGTNKKAYRNNTPTGSGSYFRFDDSANYEARLRGYVAMSDIDTGTDPFPADSQVSGGAYWAKAVNGQTSARAWFVVADDRHCYVGIAIHTNYPSFQVLDFGDEIPLKSGDAYRAMVGGAPASYYASFGGASTHNPTFLSTSDVWMPKGYLGTGLAIAAKRQVYSASAALSGAMGWTYPNGPNNGLMIEGPILFNESAIPGHIRGYAPGALFSRQNLGVAGSFIQAGQLFEVANVPLLPGQILMAVSLYNFNSSVGCGFLQLTGDWWA